MSRRNAKFATIHDLQCHVSDCTLTKRDLEFIVRGLREMDKSNFTNRDLSDHDKLVKHHPFKVEIVRVATVRRAIR